MSLVGKDYYIYREKLEDCSNRELIDRSEEIASVMAAYRYLTGENSLTAEEIDYLLRFDRPLVEVVKYCPADRHKRLYCRGVVGSRYFLSSGGTGRAAKISAERLQDAIQKVQRPPAAEEMIHDSGAR